MAPYSLHSALLYPVIHPQWHPIPYIVHYFWLGPIGFWSKVVHSKGNRESFGIDSTNTTIAIDLFALLVNPYYFPPTGMSPASSHGSEETTSTSGEPEQHRENHDTATTSHHCFGCGQEFPAAYDLLLHQRTHMERGFYKSVCGELFYQKELLKTHHQKVDTGEKPQRSF